MANELSLNISFSFNKPSVTPGPIGPVTAPVQITVNGDDFQFSSIEAPITTPAVVPLGSVTSPHWSFWQNNDLTNYVTLQNGLSGAIFSRLAPGEFAAIPLDLNCVPYILANTAPVDVTYLILPN